jgi:ABC-2 type transport system ATP-binding protein
VLVLDEPTVGLDAVAKQQVFEELLAAVGEGNRTVLISSHALTDLERFADHVGILSQGRMILEGPMTDVVARFRIVDVIVPRGFDASVFAGVVVQRRDGDRWRLLVDLQSDAMHAIEQLGLQIAGEAPVNLEELFVALAKDPAA